MLEGLTIIKVIEATIATGTTTWGFSWVGLGLVLLALANLIMACYSATRKKPMMGLFVLSLLAVITCNAVAITNFRIEVTEPVTRYQILIDENLSVSKLVEEYTIVEQVGNSLIIEEKRSE